MKIKYIVIPLILLSLWVYAEDCEYLRDAKKNQLEMSNEGQFNYEYAYQLCLLNNPIHEDIKKHLLGIRDTKWKKIGEMITDTGNTFCRGYFWECDEKSFYGRFLNSCEEARTKTKEIIEKNQKLEAVSAELIWFSYTSCPTLAESYVTAYKEVAAEEVARYHSKAIESSNYEYFKATHAEWNRVAGTMADVNKSFANFTKSVGGLTQKIYLGGQEGMAFLKEIFLWWWS